MKQDEHGAHEPPFVQQRQERKTLLARYGFSRSAAKIKGPIGLAFSGGGIRSATLSLGLTQALARRGLFFGFDYISTVSGGGYFGSFLRSLFIPSHMRGKTSSPENEPELIRAQFEFADQVLMSPPDKTVIPVGKEDIKNPIWWLRENGRYLAPDGATDYAYAIAYIVRNWLTMLYVFAIGILSIFALLQCFLLGVAWMPGRYADGLLQGWMQTMGETHLVSPIFLVIVPIIAAMFLLGAAYWTTVSLNKSLPFLKRNYSGDDSYIATMALMAIGLWLGGRIKDSVLHFLGSKPASMPPLANLMLDIVWYFLLGMLIISLLFRSAVDIKKGRWQGERLPEMRRLLTLWLSRTGMFLLIILGLGVVDTCAIRLRDFLLDDPQRLSINGLLMTVASPLLAILIKKLPDWFGGSNSGIVKALASRIWTVALIAGIFLFGLLAVQVDTLAHMALWSGKSWALGEEWCGLNWETALIGFGLVLLLALLTAMSPDFINLSSLYALYASRLTRAYVGASNIERLNVDREGLPEKPVNEGHPDDFIDAQTYQTAPIAAPLHLINMTLNVTRGGGQLVSRDRKGERAIVHPEGFKAGKEHQLGWNELDHDGAERFTIGQLCAISGAAASSAMGRMTTLGGALALTYANVRLGYWWRRADLSKMKKRDWRGVVFGPFIYLLNEMTARYSTDYQHLYLTDGGHSENSAVLALLEQGCELVVASDNGEDGNFDFLDLEILMRTARIDAGIEIEIVSAADTRKFSGEKASVHFFNMAEEKWRQAARDPEQPGFALLLGVRKIADGGVSDPTYISRIIWLKPTRFSNLPLDISSYAEANPTFPHQSTVDQFFDEQQWESYRRLGYEMGCRMFGRRRGITPGILPIVKREQKREVGRKQTKN